MRRPAAHAVADGTRRRVLRAAVACGLLPLARARAADAELTAGPFVPTPQDVVLRMLELARVGPADRVYDLGCGDGRLLVAAAHLHGASGLGVDLDPELIAASREAARRAGVADRVRFEVRDLLQTDVSQASVVVLYVLPGMMALLRPKLLAELAPGARVVSHDFSFGDWAPDRSLVFDSEEKRELVGIREVTLRFWVVPARAAGRWRVELAAPLPGAPDELALRQSFQRLEGKGLASGAALALTDLRLEGAELRFAVPAGSDADGARHVFRGRISGETIEGGVEPAGGGQPVGFRARRVARAGEAGSPAGRPPRIS